MSDEALTETIRRVIVECPFAGEGHRKVRARLRREHDLVVGKNRVLRLMRTAALLAPQRAKRRRRPRPHDGRVITDAPNLRWGTDATMAWTKTDGWVWVFVLVDHHTDEAWTHVAKVGNRFAALQPVYDAVIDRFGRLGPNVAPGIKLRHDWGSQYRAHHFQRSLTWLGITDDAAFWVNPRATGWPSGSSGHSRNSVSGHGSSTTPTTSVGAWPPSFRPTTPSGSSNAWVTAPRERRSSKRPLRWRRDSQ
jgi:putative transposase